MTFRISLLQSLLAIVAFALAAACVEVPIDDQRNDRRLFPPAGVIRGTVTYVGPRPCSRDGHIVGNAVLLVFDRRNPPPPAGVATSAVNFVAVPGDVLFANEPRSVANEISCPPTEPSITASAPFTIAPLEGASYTISAFYDRRGRFWPTFKFRNLPEAGDIAGGYLDVEDARKNAQNPNYTPVFLPVDVGLPSQAAEGESPSYAIGRGGYVADNIPVVIGSVVPFTRPYFHPEKADELPEPVTSPGNELGDPLAVPIVTMAQDARILAPPANPTLATLDAYQKSFRSVKLVWGVPARELEIATDPREPFGLQLPPLPPAGNGGLLVYARGRSIPENPAVPDLWPQVALLKLAHDPLRISDPQSLVVQGSAEETIVTGAATGPIIALQGITLLDDSLPRTISGPIPASPGAAALRDHVTVLFRPAVLCLDPRRPDRGGVLVTPHFVGQSADANETSEKPLFDQAAVASQRLVREVKRGCLPIGRYAISLVYPTGQAWTVPNEIGGCAPSEGPIDLAQTSASCRTKPRPVLLSQGARAVLEIVRPGTPEGQKICEENPVPDACLRLE